MAPCRLSKNVAGELEARRSAPVEVQVVTRQFEGLNTNRELSETAATGSQSTVFVSKPPRTPIVNFPVPREIRDQIYGYLFDVEGSEVNDLNFMERVEVLRQGGFETAGIKADPPPPMPLHMAVLRVNKTIGTEAAAYLYGDHAFVSIRYSLPNFYLMKWVFCVPTIKTVRDQAIDFKQHCLKINIGWPAAPTSDEPRKDKGSTLMLLKHLPMLCEMLRFLCERSLPPAAIVRSDKGKRPALHREKAIQFPLIQVRGLTTPYRSLNPTEKTLVLRNLRKIVGAGYGMVLEELERSPDGLKDTDVIKATAPSLIWPNALVTSAVESTQSIMHHVNELAVHNDIDDAIVKAATVLGFDANNRFLLHIGRLFGKSPPDRFISSSARWFSCTLDVDFTVADLSMRLRPQGMHSTHLPLGRFLHCDKGQISPRAVLHGTHLGVMANIVGHSNHTIHPGAIRTFRQHIEDLQNLKLSDERVDHDIEAFEAIITEYEGKPNTTTMAADILHRFSLWALPFRPYDDCLAYHDKHRPLPDKDDLVDWVDVRHLEQLSGAEKAWIQEYQKKRYLKVSIFE